MVPKTLRREEGKKEKTQIGRKRSNTSSLDENPKMLSAQKAFPAFVPEFEKYYHVRKKSWKPISQSSKNILMQFAKRAKSNCLSMTPEGRKEEVIAMFNRIIHSAFFKIDERLFPKSEMDSDTYDIGTIGMALEEQKKQNALLSHSLQSIEKEIESEKSTIEQLEAEKKSLKESSAEIIRRLPSLMNVLGEQQGAKPTSEEEIVKRRRRIGPRSLSWRRAYQTDHAVVNPVWKDMKQKVNERVESEKPLRKVIKRMAEIDRKLDLIIRKE